MPKSRQRIRILLLLLLPLILVLSSYVMYADCIHDPHNLPDLPYGCGFPFSHTIIHPGFHEEGISDTRATNYLGLLGDIVFWLVPVAIWIATFRRFGKRE